MKTRGKQARRRNCTRNDGSTQSRNKHCEAHRDNTETGAERAPETGLRGKTARAEDSSVANGPEKETAAKTA